MKTLFFIVLILVAFVSCDWIGHEPRVEGEVMKYFDYMAQKHVLKIIRHDGLPYDHKIAWHIDELSLMDKNGRYRIGKDTKQVDTLANGDMRISYDWITCIVPRNKASIWVVLEENKTDSTRVAHLHTKSEGKVTRPQLYIHQRPKGQ